VSPKGPLKCKRCQRFGYTQRNCGYAPRCVTCGVSHLSKVIFPAETASVLWLRRKPHGELPGLLLSGKRLWLPLQSKRPSVPESVPYHRSGSSADRALCRARGGITSSKGACCQVHQDSTPNPNPSQPFTEAPKQPKRTATRKTVGP
jgi:hypothetical protein